MPRRIGRKKGKGRFAGAKVTIAFTVAKRGRSTVPETTCGSFVAEKYKRRGAIGGRRKNH